MKVSLYVQLLSLFLFLGRSQLLRLACHHSLLKLHFLVLYIRLFTLAIEIEEPDGVGHEPMLEVHVERALRSQARSMVDLDEPWLKINVQHNIEPQDLKAKLVFNVVWLTAPVKMPKRRMSSYQRFDDDVLEALFQDLNLYLAITAALFPYNVMIDLFQASLVSIS